MLCRQCGTEIADKALICYRCGAPTTEARVKAPEIGRRRPGSSLIPAAVALSVLVLAALFMGQTQTGDVPRVVAAVLIGLALIVVIGRLFRRR